MTSLQPEVLPYTARANVTAVHAEDSEADRAIAEIAGETGLPLADVAARYEEELASLKAGATINLYLGLLAAKRVREALRHHDVDEHVTTTRQ